MADDPSPEASVDRSPDETDFMVVYPNLPSAHDVDVASGEQHAPPPAQGDETNDVDPPADDLHAPPSSADEEIARNELIPFSSASSEEDAAPITASFVLHPPTYADTLVFDGLAPVCLAGRFWSRTQVLVSHDRRK